jgi:hypothetical protein
MCHLAGLAFLLLNEAKCRRPLPRDHMWYHLDSTNSELGCVPLVDYLPADAILSCHLTCTGNEGSPGA